MKTTFRLFAFAGLFFLYPLQALADKMVMPGDLIYKHANLETACEKCHAKFDKAAQSGLCADCHKGVGKDVAEKHGLHGRLEDGRECSDCHPDHKGRYALATIFDKAKFDHAQTDYRLIDGHADPKVKCESCHKPGKKYSEAPTVCNECHKKGDKHKGMMGSDCERCHSEKTWKTVVFDHNKTEYKLLGRHSVVKCVKCHLDDKYKETPKLCNSCHKKDDIHKGIFGTKCDVCHVERNWKEAPFDHDRKTAYPLLFKHKQLKCVSCHKDDWIKGKLKTACISCHQKDDKHKGNFGPRCETCHVERDWKEILFDHERQTRIPLRGKHKQAKCAGCHTSGRLADKVPALCLDCHEKDDIHKSKYGPMCDTCHNEKNWQETFFDHFDESGYRIVGKHIGLKCWNCHKTRIYEDETFRKDCYYCHAKDDVHKGKEGKTCETCHTEMAWKQIIGKKAK